MSAAPRFCVFMQNATMPLLYRGAGTDVTAKRVTPMPTICVASLVAEVSGANKSQRQQIHVTNAGAAGRAARAGAPPGARALLRSDARRLGARGAAPARARARRAPLHCQVPRAPACVSLRAALWNQVRVLAGRRRDRDGEVFGADTWIATRRGRARACGRETSEGRAGARPGLSRGGSGSGAHAAAAGRPRRARVGRGLRGCGKGAPRRRLVTAQDASLGAAGV